MPKRRPKSQHHFTVHFSLGINSYDAVVGKDAISLLDINLTSQSRKAFLISDRSLHLHRKKVISNLKKSGWQVFELAVPAGEKFKEFSSIYPIYGKMLKLGLDRSSTIFALGGGSIGDAAGFIASTFMRGISWVGLPTTLLAQVDSSVGGKTAINHHEGQNLIGSFYQPSLVVCDTNFLKTLSQREIISGLGEIMKYSLIYDKNLFGYLNTNLHQILKLNSENITHLITLSLQWKAKTVSKDVFDRTGLREVLNFGHTFGHALETLTNYEVFQHGEAVIWGMRFASALSNIRGHLTKNRLEKIEKLLRQIPVPPLPKSLRSNALIKAMRTDKKSENGKVRFVLLRDLGKTISDKEINQDDLVKAFKYIGGHDAR